MNTDELKQKIAEAIANGTLQPHTIVLGDNVQHKIENVEPGGIGIQIINNPTCDQPVKPQPEQTRQDQPQQEESVLQDGSIDLHLQLFTDAILKVQDIKYSEKKFEKLIAKTYDWYAVLRLGKDLGLLNSYDDMVGLMKGDKFKCVPGNPQNLNPYKQHILATTKYPDWTYRDQSSEPYFRKFKAIADATYSIYCAGCKTHHIKPYGPGRK